MKKQLLAITIFTLFILGCGGGGEESKASTNGGIDNPTTVQDPTPSSLFDAPMLKKAQVFDVNNIMTDLKGLSNSNFIETYKKVHALQLSGFPELHSTFDVNSTTLGSSPKSGYNAKIIYENRLSRKDEYACANSGTVSKEVRLSSRGTLDADTYKTGDDTKYQYTQCDDGSKTYNGAITYHVNDFTKFDYTFGAIPLGTFESRFNDMSIETDIQKVTLRGTIKFMAKAQYKPEPDGSLISLETTYATVGDFVVDVYDKSTGETTTLTYNGVLEKIVYAKSGSGASNTATEVQTNVQGFTYRKTTNYSLYIGNSEDIVGSTIKDNQSGVVGSDGQVDIRPVGYDYGNASGMETALHSILHMVLADGSSRYVLDYNADYFPEADIHEGTPVHTLPPSDVDLMGDVVVIGFDSCAPTTALRAKLNALNIPYLYVNILASQKERDIFDWFHIPGVPYMGIKGSYGGVAGYTQNHLQILFNLHGFDMNDTVVKENRLKTASVKLEGWLETLQSKEKHTAMAVAIDTPHLYQAAWVWGRGTQEKAKSDALTDCEKLRSERVSKGKKPVRSECKIYSTDGVKQ